MNVMQTLASCGKRVVLIDSDLRCSSLARRYRFTFSRRETPGLAQYLAGMCDLVDVEYETVPLNVRTAACETSAITASPSMPWAPKRGTPIPPSVNGEGTY